MRPLAIAGGAAALIALSPLAAPQVLAFPYKTESAIGPVWSERPIDEVRLGAVTGEARALLAASPIAEPDERRPIFLTDGGWRWLWLANASRGGFALTRPVSAAVIVNESDVAANTVDNGAATRTLSAILAHEFVHGIQRRRYGLGVALKPQWLTEGYADYVAQESTLSDTEAEALIARGEHHPALPYWEGRKRVASALEANGGNVDALFLGEAE